MKTIAPERTYIDYWQRRGNSCSGVRVWPGRCRAIASDPDEGPEGLLEFGEYFSIPLDAELRSRRIGALSEDPPIVQQILWHMACTPSSDLRDLLEGKRPFCKALLSVVEEHYQATAGNVS